MNRIDFLKTLGFGGLATAVVLGTKYKVNDEVELNQSNSLQSVPAELEFTILKDDEVFHPIHTDYKVNRMGEVSYINYKNKVRKCTVSKHKTTGQIGFRMKDRSRIAGRFIFEAFTKVKLNQSYVIIPKDGNELNLCIDNLQCIRKSDHNKYKHTYIARKPIRDNYGKVIKWV
jgi:hypothetical protein